jgi:2-oxoglutarate ferredoxin oxidoreductase subunit alpha
VLVPELNLGQLAKLIRMEHDVNVVKLNKIKGVHFRAAEIEACILELTEND